MKIDSFKPFLVLLWSFALGFSSYSFAFRIENVRLEPDWIVVEVSYEKKKEENEFIFEYGSVKNDSDCSIVKSFLKHRAKGPKLFFPKRELETLRFDKLPLHILLIGAKSPVQMTIVGGEEDAEAKIILDRSICCCRLL